MRLKKKPVPGKCLKTRCIEDVAEGSRFCAPHKEEGEAFLVAQGQAESSVAFVETEKVEAEISPDKSWVENLLPTLDTWEIKTQSDMDWAKQAMDYLKERADDLENKRKAVSAPLNKAIRAHNGMFNPVIKAMLAARKKIGDKIVAVEQAQKVEQDKALEAVQAAGGAVDAEVLSVAHGQEHVNLPDGVHTRGTWKFEILNEAQLPRELLSPDTGKIRAYVAYMTSTGQDANIPNVLRVYQEQTAVAVK